MKNQVSEKITIIFHDYLRKFALNATIGDETDRDPFLSKRIEFIAKQSLIDITSSITYPSFVMICHNVNQLSQFYRRHILNHLHYHHSKDLSACYIWL